MFGIGVLNEKPLHAALKQWCARPGDRFDVAVDGFVIDLVRDDLSMEIQTGHFASIKSKLTNLTRSRQVRLVYQIAEEKWIVWLAADASGELMDKELSVVSDFVRSNRKAMANYVRQKLIAAGAKQYLDRLGKEGIESLDHKMAGVLLDLACALLRRLHPVSTPWGSDPSRSTAVVRC